MAQGIEFIKDQEVQISSDTQAIHYKVKPLTLGFFDQIWISQDKFHENMFDWWIWSRKIKRIEVTYKKGNFEEFEIFSKYQNFHVQIANFQNF